MRLPRTTTNRGLPGPRQKISPVYEIAGQCGAEGIEAYKKGVAFERNPYPSGSVNARAWEQAWLMAEEKAKRLGIVRVV